MSAAPDVPQCILDLLNLVADAMAGGAHGERHFYLPPTEYEEMVMGARTVAVMHPTARIEVGPHGPLMIAGVQCHLDKTATASRLVFGGAEQ